MATVVTGPEISPVSEDCSSDSVLPTARQHAKPSTIGGEAQGELDLNDVTQSSAPQPCDSLDEQATSLEWFRSTFSHVEKNGIITLKDFKHRAKKDQFAEHLFNLLDTEDTGSVGLQELMGGMGRLLSQSRKRSHLKWFEELFIQISGDDEQPIGLEDFKAAVHTEHFLDKLYNLLVSDNEELTLTVMLNAFNNILSTDKDHRWLEWFEQKFSSLPDEIDFDQFKKILHIKESFFAERFFHIFDKGKTERISRRELKDGLLLLTSGSEVDKLRFLFQIYDIDGSGHILFEELRTVLKSCMGESALQFNDDQLDELTRTLLEDADATNSGSITFEELQSALSRHPGLVENLTFSAANWFQPGIKSHRRRRFKRIPHWMRPYYFRNNLTWIMWLAIFFTVNIILFLEASILYRNEGTAALSIARGSGQCLNFTSTFVIILMFRHLLTWIRSTSFHFLFPLDESIRFHKLVGWTTLFLSMVHVIAHIVNFTLISLRPGSLPLWQYFFYVETGFGWVFGTAGLTGVLLSIIFVIMVLFALSCVRRKGFFEVFYWTHHLFIAFYILLILHATDFWKWFLGPGLIYIIERIIRSKWIKLARYGRFYVKSAYTLPSKVTYLALTRPRRFNYQAGDYVFLKIPSIAKTEWHPFTISSSPEQDFIGLHVRAVGTWTKKLYELIEKRNKTLNRTLESTTARQEAVEIELPVVTESHLDDQSAGVSFNAESKIEDSMVCGVNETKMDTIVSIEDGVKHKGDRMEVFIDGPYGSPSFHIFQAEHAVLIGAGIGVTPFASILQSIANKYRSIRQVCPRCHHGWTGEIPSAIMRLRKVDFYWINRDQRSFEWFVRLLTNLEIEESDRELNSFERFLDFHLYMTSALRKTDMKALGLQMALDLLHKKENRDLITGLRTRTQTGRPDWDKVFQYLASVKKGKVSVFYCGPSAISKVLKAKCAKYRFEFRKEHF